MMQVQNAIIPVSDWDDSLNRLQSICNAVLVRDEEDG